jgi:hypothetical protein
MPFRLDGVRVYAVASSKSKNRHGRVTYGTRSAALKALGHRGPRDHTVKIRTIRRGKKKAVIK